LNKVISSIALVGVLGIGGIVTFSIAGDSEKPQKIEEPSKQVTAESNDEEVVEISVPTERTVETNGDVPWNYMTSEQIIAKQEAGEIVYLFSDAQSVEEYTLSLANNPDTTPYNKEDLADSWSGQIDAFIQGVKEYYPNELDYFMKLEEVKNAMSAYEYEKVAKLIEEASALR
jgi:hypothetical protein